MLMNLDLDTDDHADKQWKSRFGSSMEAARELGNSVVARESGFPDDEEEVCRSNKIHLMSINAYITNIYYCLNMS